MNMPELKINSIYTLIGVGEMKLISIGKDICCFASHGNYNYHANISQIVREASDEDIKLRIRNRESRNIKCTDPECWCRKYDNYPSVNEVRTKSL